MGPAHGPAPSLFLSWGCVLHREGNSVSCSVLFSPLCLQSVEKYIYFLSSFSPYNKLPVSHWPLSITKVTFGLLIILSLLLTAQQAEWASGLCWFPLPSQSHGGNIEQNSLSGYCVCSGFVSQLKTTKFENLHF